MLQTASKVFLCLAFLDLFFLGYCVVTGFPPNIGGLTLRLKNTHTPFIGFLLLMGLSLVSHPGRLEKAEEWKNRILSFVAKPYAIWFLFGIYTLLFTWQQITEYLAVEINFIPFSFYSYMLYYFFEGKLNYTYLLHDYYHLNHILYFLAPLWKIFQSPFVLVASYGVIAAAAIFPLYGIARKKLEDSLLAFVIAFLYLNYRYLQNVLRMNFSVEIFYPLFVFSAVYFALKTQWLGYYISVVLGLLVKEDSFLYFAAVGMLIGVMKNGKRHGIVTVGLSLLYLALLVKVVIPMTGSTILDGDLANFKSPDGGHLLSNLTADLSVKVKTCFNLLYRLGFLPLFSPAVVLVSFPLLPLFLHHTGKDWDFYELHFHYAATVIPFVFIAFVYGYSNILKKFQGRAREVFTWGSCLILILLNGVRYTSQNYTKEDIKSIQWAKSIPADANLVTHGHLLPYIGYRKYNYYLAPSWEDAGHKVHAVYANADYVLIDFNVNPFPLGKALVKEKKERLSSDPNYELIREDGTRFLFKRKDFPG